MTNEDDPKDCSESAAEATKAHILSLLSEALSGEAVHDDDDDDGSLESLAKYGYVADWADTAIRKSHNRGPLEKGSTLWLQEALQRKEWALVKHGEWWVNKGWDGIHLFHPRRGGDGGFAFLQQVLTNGFLVERPNDWVLSAGSEGQEAGRFTGLRDAGADILRGAELIREAHYRAEARTRNDPFGTGNPPEEHCYQLSGASAGNRVRFDSKNLMTGKLKRWAARSTADSVIVNIRNAIDGALQQIEASAPIHAQVIRQGLKYQGNQVLYNGHIDESGNFIPLDLAPKFCTEIDSIPYDASLILRGSQWEVTFPDTGPFMVPAWRGMDHIARIFTCWNQPCPMALIADEPLRSAFLDSPPHRKYFTWLHRQVEIAERNPRIGELERTLLSELKAQTPEWRPEWEAKYHAHDLISEESPLHVIGGLPCGFVAMTAQWLAVVVKLLERQQSRLFFCTEPTAEFKQLLADMRAGVKFAQRYEELLSQIERTSWSHSERVSKAIQEVISDLYAMGTRDTRYGRLANCICNEIKGRSSSVVQYVGPLHWQVEGVRGVLNPIDLANDHISIKAKRAAKLRYKTMEKRQAMQRERAHATRTIDGPRVQSWKEALAAIKL